MKKILALVLALLVALSMTAAFAATTTNNGATTSTDTTLTIKKEIAFFNPTEGGANINYPAVTYNYTIAPTTVAANTTITDTKDPSVTVNVKSGVQDGVVMDTDASAAFAAGTVKATPKGTLVEETFGIKVDLSKFTGENKGAGVYRYTLTESAPENLTNLGYEAATATNGTVRYLDVYIRNNTTTKALEVYGYVLFHSVDGTKESIDGSDTTDVDGKTTGFTHEDDESTDTDYTDDTYVDKYKTYNVDITKTITGALGDKTHPFPINVAIAAGADASNIVLPVTLENTSTYATSNESITLTNGAYTDAQLAKLADGDKVTITGIPVGSTLTIYETNDTADKYKVTSTGLASNQTSVELNAGATSAASTVTTNNIELKSVTYQNDLPEISPTGVVLRFAPYIAMLAGGVLLLVLSRKRRSHKDED